MDAKTAIDYALKFLRQLESSLETEEEVKEYEAAKTQLEFMKTWKPA
jgi:hypothetical protein